MARNKGTANLSANLEVKAGAPLDARSVVPAKADLTASDNFPYKYIGMEVYVVAEDKKYRLIGNDPTNIENWKLISEEAVTIDSEMSTTSENALQNKVITNALDSKVDKVEGKGLSTNDYTTAEKTKLADINLSNYIPTSEKGAVGGVAELDSSGKVLSAQLPSYVDDVISKASKDQFPLTGEDDKIYVDKSTNKTYRWDGTDYIEISGGVALGETAQTAYRGDRGKAAYDDSQTNKTNIGNLENLTTTDKTSLVGAINELKAQGGGTIDATPTSGSTNAVQSGGVYSALATKVNTESGKGLSTNDYTTAEKTKLASLSNYDDTELSGRVDDIEDVIPSNASTSNKLATMADIGGGGTSDYDDLTNKPQIEGVTLSGNKSLDDLGIQEELTFDSTPTQSSSNPVTSGGVYSALDSKVDKVNGKGLSTNDYDAAEKQKVANAQPKTLATPITVDGTQQTTVEGALDAINTLAEQGSGGTSDYTELTNKPQIGGVTLTGNKSLADLGIEPFDGATSGTAGSAGLVPAPAIADVDKFLKGDGTWAMVQSGGADIVRISEADYDALTSEQKNNGKLYFVYLYSLYEFHESSDGKIIVRKNKVTGTIEWFIKGLYIDKQYSIPESLRPYMPSNVATVNTNAQAYTTEQSTTQNGWVGFATAYQNQLSAYTQDFRWYYTSTFWCKINIANGESQSTTYEDPYASIDYEYEVYYMSKKCSYKDFIGATSQDAGVRGLVPRPETSDVEKYLKGDGTWGNIDFNRSFVQLNETEYQALTEAEKKNGKLYFTFAYDYSDYEFHESNDGKIVVRKQISTNTTIWFLKGFTVNNQTAVPSELVPYIPSEATSNNINAKAYTNAQSTTQNGWVGFDTRYQNKLTAYTVNLYNFTSGTFWSKINQTGENQNTTYEDPYELPATTKGTYSIYYMGFKYGEYYKSTD